MSFEDFSKILEGDQPRQITGTVLAVQANFYQVRLQEETLPKLMLLCTRRTRLKKIGQRVMVGDRVLIEEPDWNGARGAISQVFPRRSELDRPPIANVDQILLVFALASPTIEPYQLSRFLVKAESTGVAVCLALSKSDLVSIDEQECWKARLGEWGYQPIFISVHQQLGLIELKQRLNQKITVASGPSGVGKSSLINQIIPNIDLRVSAVSGKLEKGRHTTRHVELFELPTGGLLADTPGFNQPDLCCLPQELVQYFPEARRRLAEGSCQFSNCLHRDEPGCTVRGEWERYEHYLNFLEDAIVYETQLNQQSDPDEVLKLKTTGKGTEYEPRLELKKYRRESRRNRQQSLRKLDIDQLMKSEENENLDDS
ncbi:small ribosomal subunit biogenesis GTPase RsgA [Leptolyngbya sp. FACHB-17]|uniref:small ribosomal subunit biogenesis GTPase RsgA n=1 Tax=unclassified Leptolyngbya TaxID=2650499 RepID=UPI0016800B6E|nr:small ribosomal subunit biogenesis GTPase RsgA [Leptolyngbya sp. FACHB-17]MBD2082317.1 small ribosomal subunit biogenesis GTPase RsgA [Leptolyngbya sp. FACHB-17]